MNEISTEVDDPLQRTNERSLVNVVPDLFQKALIKSHALHPDLYGMDEKELRRTLLKTHMTAPTQTDNHVRWLFWAEYNFAQEQSRPMKLTPCFAGACDIHFLHKTLKNPLKVAWLMCQPKSYELLTEEALNSSLRRLGEVLEESPVNEAGAVNVKLGELQLKIAQFLDARVKGAVVQRTMNINANVPGRAVSSLEKASKEELERRLSDIEDLSRKAQGFNDARAVESKQE